MDKTGIPLMLGQGSATSLATRVEQVGSSGEKENVVTLRHSAIQIPEILTAIFEQCDNSGRAVAARVSHQWSILALAELWRCIQNILDLFRILGPIEIDYELDEYMFSESIAGADWDRFDAYARRVRYVRWYGDQRHGSSTPISDKVFGQIYIHRPDHHSPLMPNVTTIDWYATSDVTAMQLLPLLHSSPVKDLTLTLYEWCTEKVVEAVIRGLTKRNLNLVRLGLDVKYPASVISKPLSELYQQQKSLRSIDLPPFYGTKEIVAALGGLESLEEMGSWEIQNLDFRENWGANHWVFLEDTFRSLTRFEMDNSFQEAAEIIRFNTPTRLSHIRLQIYQQATNYQLKYFLSVLATCCPLLKKLELHLYTRPALFPDEGPNSGQETLLFESLQPLLRCPEVEFFEIVHNRPMILFEQNVAAMAAAWPRLSTLSITPDPTDLPTSDSNDTPTTPLSILHAFSQHFPTSLKRLCLFMKIHPTELKRSRGLSHRFSGLKQLNVGRTIPKGDLMHIVGFLCDICPPDADVFAESEWATRFVALSLDEDNGITGAQEKWEKIAKKVKEIHRWEGGRRARGAQSWYQGSDRCGQAAVPICGTTDPESLAASLSHEGNSSGIESL
ncbi:hypothetical protein FRB98_007758 [Tulasnella sp. 332]|nr:hypothetical protein FRB98_007758 [Tulasnella sp. 332]